MTGEYGTDVGTRYHEAGHAVAALVLRQPITRVVVRLGGKSFVDGPELPPDASRAALEAEALVSVSGTVAERAATGGGTMPAKDLFGAAACLVELGEPWATVWRKLGPLEQEAAKLLRTHWAAVERLAGALGDCPEMTPEQAAAAAGLTSA